MDYHEIKLAQGRYKRTKNIAIQVIAIHRRAMMKLEQQIEDERLETEHGELICKDCNIISMKYIGKFPQDKVVFSEKDYQCEICGGRSILYQRQKK